MIKLKKNPPEKQTTDEQDAPAQPKKKKVKAAKSQTEPQAKGSLGKTLGVVFLLLIAGGGAAAYLNPDLVQTVGSTLGLTEEVVAEEETTPIPTPAPQPNTPTPEANHTDTAPQPAAPPAPVAFEAQADAVNALNMAKVWVNARLSKGMNLFDINETIPLSSADKQHWQSIQVNQGTISAIHVNTTAENPTILMPLQDGNQIKWICAGAIPVALESMCQ